MTIWYHVLTPPLKKKKSPWFFLKKHTHCAQHSSCDLKIYKQRMLVYGRKKIYHVGLMIHVYYISIFSFVITNFWPQPDRKNNSQCDSDVGYSLLKHLGILIDESIFIYFEIWYIIHYGGFIPDEHNFGIFSLHKSSLK